MKPRIRGLYAVTPDEPDTDALCLKVEAVLAGGASVLQYRNKTAAAALRAEQAERLHALCRRHGVPFIVNDDLALALEAGAEGLHLGRDDGSIREARARLGPERVIGVSCYDELQRARDAVREGADYVAFGAAYPSRIKPDAVHAAPALYAAAKRELPVPVVAIGGITLDNAAALLALGVDALAVISALFDAEDVKRAAQSFEALFGSRP